MLPTLYKQKNLTNDWLNEFDRFFYNCQPAETSQTSPNIDIYEDDNDFVLEMDLPGLNKEDVSITLTATALTIKGTWPQKRENKQGYIRNERATGSFERQFSIKTPINNDKATADYKDGVLTLTLPKQESAKPKQVEIKIN